MVFSTFTAWSAIASLTEATNADEPCCKTCTEPLKKYYSVDAPHGFCGEACMDPSKFNLYKIFEKNLTLADSDSPCKDQYSPTGTHYTEYSETVTHGVPGLLAVTLDLYGPGAELSLEDERCCETCAEPLKKYYSVDAPHGFCGEACMDPSKFNLYKIFEKNLTLADSDSPCKDQFSPTGTHYTEYSETVTHGVPGLLAVTLDLFGPGAELSFEDNTCSAEIGHCGRAYQTCCIGYGAKGFPCGCSLTDGSGSSVGDCGTCGAAYQICCDGYKADGYPCNCNVAGAFTGFSV